ncbi:MAG: cytochrome c oxidase subunit 3 [Rhodospirillales bacterium]
MATTEQAQHHHWHVPEPSKWPIIGTVSALTTAIGGVIYMHSDVPWLLIAGLVAIIYTFFGWCSQVVVEATKEKAHSGFVRTSLRISMLLFIASEVMFFFAFFWAFFHSSIPALSKVAQEVWPPEGVIPFDPWTLPFLNTLILLTSGATCTYAHHAVQKGDNAKTAKGLAMTVVLGVLFTALQAFEYSHAHFGFTDGIFSSTFYLATGFHGFHVIVGTIFLIVCWFRARAGHFTAESHVGFEAAAWYWHFVDVVWLFLFCCIYWWGSAGFDFSAVANMAH